MRRVSIVIAVCFVLALAISLVGQGRNLDTIMKEIGPLYTGQGGIGARGGGSLDAATPDTAKVAADAAKLQSLFKEAEAEFTKMKMVEPAGVAKGVSEAAGKLAAEAKTGKIGDAKAAKAAIGQCKGCHDKYRESDGAGGFKLKMN